MLLILRLMLLGPIFFTSCSIFKVYERSLVNSNENFAIHELNKKEVLSEHPFIRPGRDVKISEKKLRLILSSIESGSTVPGLKTFRVFSESQLTLLIPEIMKIIPGSAEKLYYVITKEEDRLAPATRINRNSFLIFWNGSYLNLIFGDVVQNIIFGNQYSFPDWGNPSVIDIQSNFFTPISVKRLSGSWGGLKKNSGEDCVLSPQEIEEEKELKCRWIYFDPERLQAESANKKSLESNTEIKLKELKSFFEKGLIEKVEYEKKRKEILEKF